MSQNKKWMRSHIQPEKDTTLIGSRFKDSLSEVVVSNHVDIIEGLPACPECSYVLDKDFKGNWNCHQCSTRYTSKELVEVLFKERRLNDSLQDSDSE